MVQGKIINPKNDYSKVKTKNLEIKFQLSWLSHPRLDASGYMELHLFPWLLLLLHVVVVFFSFVSLSLQF